MLFLNLKEKDFKSLDRTLTLQDPKKISFLKLDGTIELVSTENVVIIRKSLTDVFLTMS
jgi:hypothetical protein